MHPLKIKINDGFYCWQTLRNFSGFFHPRLVARVGRGSCAGASGASLRTSTPKRERVKTMNSEIRIYVADLAAYNNGKLHGVWIDATQDVSDIWEQVKTMLDKSPEPDAEEWAIHDYEGFEGASISEYESFESVHERAIFIEEHGEIGSELLSHFGDSIEDATKAIEENYNGCYRSIADYAEDLTEQTSEIPKHLEFYIDYERMGRDMELSGDVFTIETGFEEVHVFWSH